MKLTFLGTGTSHGVPVIGCRCSVCTSSDPRNNRRRPSLYIQAAGRHLIVDTPPDFRTEVLEWGVERVDAVLITHVHADHIFGFDDLRAFYNKQGAPIPVFAAPADLDQINRVFSYVHAEVPPGVTVLRIEQHPITGPVDFYDIKITPLNVKHGQADVLGYRFDAEGKSVAYVPDCSRMPERTIGMLKGVDVMILDALRDRPHPTHFSVSESLAVLKEIGAKQSYVTHCCHEVDHADLERRLPPSVSLAYDGCTYDW